MASKRSPLDAGTYFRAQITRNDTLTFALKGRYNSREQLDEFIATYWPYPLTYQVNGTGDVLALTVWKYDGSRIAGVHLKARKIVEK